MCRRYIERMDYVNEYVKALLPSRTTCSLSLCKDYRLHGQYKSNVGRRTGQNCKMVRQKEVLFLLGVMISATCGAPKFLPYPAWNTLVSNPDYLAYTENGFSSNYPMDFNEDYSLNSEFPYYDTPYSMYDKTEKKAEKSKKSKSLENSLFSRKSRTTEKSETDIMENELPEQKPDMGTYKQGLLPFTYGMTKINPMADLTAQKQALLNSLFKNLIKPTPDMSVPQSTIMPQSFFIPTSISIDPVDYNKKLNDFMKKLADKMKINVVPVSMPTSDDMQARIARSTESMSSLVAAKDNIVNTILTDLGIIKGDMVETVDDIIAYGKSATVSPLVAGKPLKPFMSSMWMKPTADPMLPFRQRMMILSKMFDMLTGLQRNVTASIEQEMKTNADTLEMSKGMDDNNFSSNMPRVMIPQDETGQNFNMTLMDAIKKRLSDIKVTQPNIYVPNDIEQQLSTMEIKQQAAPQMVTSDTSVPSGLNRGISTNYPKRSIDPSEESDNEIRHQYARGVSMTMHQGYQSLPAGAIESVQAGGGSVPGHQGGGIKLLDTADNGDLDEWMYWTQYLQKELQNHRHHHNHH